MWTCFAERFACAFHRKASDANYPFRFEDFDGFAEMLIAGPEKLLSFPRRQFVWRSIEAAFFHEGQRAVVHHKMFGKKIRRFAKTLSEQAPQSLTADFAARTIQSSDDAFGMFRTGLADLRLKFHPVAHGVDLAEWDSGLNHAPRTGIHAQEDHPLGRAAERPEISFMPGPGVIQRVIDVRHGRAELQCACVVTQPLRRSDERFADLAIAQFDTALSSSEGTMPFRKQRAKP